MKTYKLWIEIEEYDSETGLYREVTKTGEAEPVPMHVFDNLSDAIEAAESYDMFQDHLRGVTGASLEHPKNSDEGPFDKPVRDLLKRLTAAGFVLQWADDGEEVFQVIKNVDHAADILLSVDESHIGIKKGLVPFWLFIVLGNGKEEIVSDYTWTDCPEHKELEVVLDAFSAHWASV